MGCGEGCPIHSGQESGKVLPFPEKRKWRDLLHASVVTKISQYGGGEGGGGSPPLSPPGYALTARLILTFEGRRSTGRRGFSVTSAKVRAVKYCDYLDSETVIMQWTHSDILQALAVHSCFSWLAIILLLLSSSFTFFYNFYIGKVKIA